MHNFPAVSIIMLVLGTGNGLGDEAQRMCAPGLYVRGTKFLQIII